MNFFVVSEKKSSSLLKNQRKMSSLRNACESKDVEKVQKVLEEGIETDLSETHKVMELACDSGSIEIVKMLLVDKRISTSDAVINQLFIYAARTGQIKVVEMLLDDLLDPTVKPFHYKASFVYEAFGALRAVCSRGHVDIFRMFVAKYKFDLGVDGDNPLFLAVKNDRTELVKEIFKLHYSVGGKKGSPGYKSAEKYATKHKERLPEIFECFQE